MVTWRRQIHSQPELGYNEIKTSAYISSQLRQMGYSEIHEQIGGTGLIAILRAPDSQRSQPAILFRADMDALPITEDTGAPFSSKNVGIMHACGHDCHMSMVMGAAAILIKKKEELQRDVVFLFQPAEEGGGGARRMIEEGVLEKYIQIRDVFGLHVFPSLRTGVINTRKGPLMAASDRFHVVIRGF